MPDTALVLRTTGADAPEENAQSQPCVMLIFGASGDLTKRLLIPALYNLACDGLLSKNFALLGAAMDPLTTETFRDRMSADIRKFHTRKEFDAPAWDDLVSRFHYLQGAFDDSSLYERLKVEVAKLNDQVDARGNVLFYFATAPRFFGLIGDKLHASGFKDGPGWKRIIVEKPFGTDLDSALKLNREVLAHWHENQIYRVDHYLGKETVQNLLAFRFSNGIFEPLWNKHHIDNIQFNVSESVDVEGRGGYYDSSGVLRDMMQNHMFQMLAYLCMEVPGSFEPDSIRNEKAKLLQSVRVYGSEEVARYVVRGQYGPSRDDQGKVTKAGYRGEKDVNPESKTETYAAARLHVDNWRWQDANLLAIGQGPCAGGQAAARVAAAPSASSRSHNQGAGGRRCVDRRHRAGSRHGGRFACNGGIRQGKAMNPMGIFGGTFDPIHYAHLRTAFELQQALRLREIRFLPAGNPPHRDRPFADAQLRLKMVELAAAGQPGFVVDDREVRKEGPSYSVETLAELRHEYPDWSLCLIVGMDAFLSLPKWHQWRELLQLAHLVVAHRPGWRAPSMGPLGELLVDHGTGRIGDLHEQRYGCIYVHAVTQLEISSTEVRQLIAMGRDPRFLMPDSVRKLILETNCYSKTRTT